MRSVSTSVIKTGDRIRLTAPFVKAVMQAARANQDHLKIAKLEVERPPDGSEGELILGLQAGGQVDADG